MPGDHSLLIPSQVDPGGIISTIGHEGCRKRMLSLHIPCHTAPSHHPVMWGEVNLICYTVVMNLFGKDFFVGYVIPVRIFNLVMIG
jgi:hypothetical protein